MGIKGSLKITYSIMKYNIDNGDLEDFFNDLNKSETKYYDESIVRLEENLNKLFLKAYDHSLNLEQLSLLQRQLQQIIGVYEYVLKNDKFEFITKQHLKREKDKKYAGAIQDLKNALTIVETKLQHKRQNEKRTLDKKQPQFVKDIFPKNEAKVLVISEAMKDLNITRELRERQLTGFIDGCKLADALPQLNNTDLLRSCLKLVKRNI